MVTNIKDSFNIKDLGKPTRLLSTKIARNCKLSIIHISQPSFINTIAKQFEILPSHGIHAPMDPNIDLQASNQEEITSDLLYATLIGSINYCTESTHPDIAYTTNKYTQYTFKLNFSPWEVAERIVQYLQQMREYRISYQREGQGIKG